MLAPVAAKRRSPGVDLAQDGTFARQLAIALLGSDKCSGVEAELKLMIILSA